MTTSWLKDLNLKPRSGSVKTFKSYVDLNEDDCKATGDWTSSTGSNQKVEYEESIQPCSSPTLLPGELVIAEADNVLKFNTRFELNKGISGVLICTNFKITFVTAENLPSNLHQRNLILGENDICLTNIDSIYNATGGKRKKITSASSSGAIEILEIHCKNFRIYTFSFKFSPTNHRAVISAILHHAFALKLHLLFAFDYSEPESYADKNVFHSFNFTRACDWEAELRRCRCPGWRVSQANEKFLLCDNLPECFVVPSIVLDVNLNKAAPCFSGHRVPVWTWGLSGASVVRMAAKDPAIADSKQQEFLIDAIGRTNIKPDEVRIFNLEECLPSIKDVQNSFIKLRDLCMPLTSDDFWASDSAYLSKLDSTRWLQSVSSCLQVALEAACAVQNGTTVIFVENEGRDLNCVLSSLVQIFLDPFYHKQNGFQILIQKEWVALGHPFTERLHHISGDETEESPVFLLFLDCVWQLLQQCPSVFEFSETYLTTLWDSCHISLFDTFMFCCHKSRVEAMSSHSSNNKFQLRSVWNWSKQFPRQDIKLFYNPLYVLNRYRKRQLNPPSPATSRPKSFSSAKESKKYQESSLKANIQQVNPVVWNKTEENIFHIDPYLKSISLWHQCYLRWVPMANIIGGGSPVVFLSNMKLADDISNSEKILSSLCTRSKHPKVPTHHRRVASDDYTISADSIDFSQIHDESCVVTSAFPFFPVAPCEWHSFDFVPSMSCLQISYTSDDDLDD